MYFYTFLRVFLTIRGSKTLSGKNYLLHQAKKDVDLSRVQENAYSSVWILTKTTDTHTTF
jgi:hypothetical protein